MSFLADATAPATVCWRSVLCELAHALRTESSLESIGPWVLQKELKTIHLTVTHSSFVLFSGSCWMFSLFACVFVCVFAFALFLWEGDGGGRGGGGG